MMILWEILRTAGIVLACMAGIVAVACLCMAAQEDAKEERRHKDD